MTLAISGLVSFYQKASLSASFSADDRVCYCIAHRQVFCIIYIQAYSGFGIEDIYAVLCNTNNNKICIRIYKYMYPLCTCKVEVKRGKLL